jgi:hypothetical protein
VSSQGAPQPRRRAKPAAVRGEAAGARTSGRRGHSDPTARRDLERQAREVAYARSATWRFLDGSLTLAQNFHPLSVLIAFSSAER